MTRFKTLSMAALLALAAGTAMSGGAFAAVAGGGSSGDGGPGGSIGFDAPIMAITLPGTPQADAAELWRQLREPRRAFVAQRMGTSATANRSVTGFQK